MIRKIFALCIWMITAANCKAQLLSLSAALIPDSLKANAQVITEEENSFFDVTDIDRARLTVHKRFTITSAAGKRFLVFHQFSNKFISLEDAEVKVYGPDGKVSGKYKKKDMFTTAVGDGLVDEGYQTFLQLSGGTYPVTIEFDYELRFTGTLVYPGYDIQESGESILNSSFTARVPVDLDLRFKEKNIHLPPVISQVDKYKTYTWTVKNLPALEYEEDAGSYSSRYPGIILAPNHFKIYNVEGDMSSWKNFGAWEYGLINGLDALPDERKAFFKDLVKDASSDREKIKRVYEYLQKNFRYVSIQLGIGGYKPFPAAFTDQKKYGDCKGLSFYTHSVLNSLGIKSYVALINREYNDEPVDPSFPCNQFNHMILCVPEAKDSIWLECTGKTNDFGSLDPSTQNRNALLITERGGVLVPTPPGKSSDNIFTSKSYISLDESNGGNVKTSILVTGEYKEDFTHHFFQEKSDDQKYFLQHYIHFKQPDEFTAKKEEDNGNTRAVLELVYEKIPDFSAGSKLFLPMGMYKLFSFDLPKSENRRLDYFFYHPLEKTDTSVFKLPEGYIKDVLPEEKTLTCDYATFFIKCWFDEKENSIYSVEKLVLRNSKIPAAKYAAVKTFFDEVKKLNSGHIVVKKN